MNVKTKISTLLFCCYRFWKKTERSTYTEFRSRYLGTKYHTLALCKMLRAMMSNSSVCAFLSVQVYVPYLEKDRVKASSTRGRSDVKRIDRGAYI